MTEPPRERRPAPRPAEGREPACAPGLPGAADSQHDAARAGRQALYVFVATWLLVAVLVKLRITIPLVGHLGSALVALAFLYIPSGVARHRGEDLVDYGFTSEPVRRGLVAAGVAMLVIFPLFALGYLAFHELACKTALAPLVPAGLCGRYVGVAGLHAPAASLALLEYCAVQLVVVSLPEELFFRGMLLHLLTRRFPPRRRLGGVGFGWAALLTSLAFALVHLPKGNDPRALATFFPGLLFAWLRLRTGSLLAPTLVHAGSNILIHLLELMVMS
jgi:membrane protease YdiL (CAAX protease family)